MGAGPGGAASPSSDCRGRERQHRRLDGSQRSRHAHRGQRHASKKTTIVTTVCPSPCHQETRRRSSNQSGAAGVRDDVQTASPRPRPLISDGHQQHPAGPRTRPARRSRSGPRGAGPGHHSTEGHTEIAARPVGPEPRRRGPHRRARGAEHQALAGSRFLVVRAPATRASAAVMADRARLTHARDWTPTAPGICTALQLDRHRRRQVGIVVCCDRGQARPGAGPRDLPGRRPVSYAFAIENVWLTARARPRLAGSPCLNRPSSPTYSASPTAWSGSVALPGLARRGPPAPGLERPGRSRRLPLADIITARTARRALGAGRRLSRTPAASHR